MLKRLHVRNFTVFEEADFEFSPGLNVVVGTNGTGKSHVLKLGYAVEAAFMKSEIEKTKQYYGMPEVQRDSTSEYIHVWLTNLLENILKSFSVETLKNLIRRNSSNDQADIRIESSNLRQALLFKIVSDNRRFGNLESNGEDASLSETNSNFFPILIPAKEVLSVFPGLKSLNERYVLSFDKTYTDLLIALDLPSLREIPDDLEKIIIELENIMQGKILLDNGRFYLQPFIGNRFEINLVAEGIRKFGMLAQLLANGSLTPETTLFWDEPEANLNPALLRQLAALLVQLAAQGFQIILATHSLFLMKEFHILVRRQPAAQIRYFGLNERGEKGVEVTTTDDLEQLPDIVALDAEMDLADRFQEILDAEDANDN